jgi:hypothetical protein
MNPAFSSPPIKEIASWYTPGLVDGFGDRLLMFDNTDSEPLEVLRFRPAIAAAPGFHAALLARVNQLARLTHPAFPSIRAVERLETDGSLALVSTHTTGRRVSAFLAEPWSRKAVSPRFVAALLRQITECLKELQSQGADVAHNALTADRVVLMPGAGVCVIEQALGSALGALRLSPAQLWREFGLLVPSASPGVASLGPRVDVFQAGVLGLSLLLSRGLTPHDVQACLPELIEQWKDRRTAWAGSDRLQQWLRRALHVADDPYECAADAYEDLSDLPEEPILDPYEFLPARGEENHSAALTRPAAPFRRQEAYMRNAVSEKSVANVLRLEPPRPETAFEPEEHQPAVMPPPPQPPARTVPSWIAAALVAVALTQGVVVAVLMWPARAQGDPPAGLKAAASDGVSPAGRSVPAVRRASLDAAPDSSREVSLANVPARSVPASGVGRADPGSTESAIARAATNQRSGGVRLLAPIELKVLQGDRVLGSSADGPIVMSAGTYQLELINPTLGFRMDQTVTFRAGQMASLSIPVPRGRLSVNAEPWAEVWIDDRPVGPTPLANLDVALGEHRVVFRHPQLGERRQTVIVRADAPSRVSATFEP